MKGVERRRGRERERGTHTLINRKLKRKPMVEATATTLKTTITTINPTILGPPFAIIAKIERNKSQSTSTHTHTLNTHKQTNKQFFLSFSCFEHN
jgi:hypothetical protein